MTSRKRFFQLSIRQKVMAGFSLSILAFLLIGIIAYRNIVKIEDKLRFVETASRLHDTILEVRRYEKNFLLYQNQEDYHLALTYVRQGQQMMERIHPQIHQLEGAAYLRTLQQELQAYSTLLKEIGAIDPHTAAAAFAEVESQLRERGKNLVDLSLQVARFEYTRIHGLTRALKAKLGFLLVILSFLGLFLGLVVSRKIVKPLRVIEKTTRRVAQGDFRNLPVLQTGDETQIVVEAFNKMVVELEKRQDQLVQAQKLSSLGILTSGIAHQLNNPLNNISTSGQILMEELSGDTSEYVAKLLKNIVQEVDRARDIVKGLLEFSREREFQLGWVNLNDLVLKTIRLVASQVPAGVEIQSDVPAELKVFADGQRLQEVILNLLLNASQAMTDGHGTISITARQDPSAGTVQIEVRDTGCGIPPEILPRIFDPFFTTKEVGTGTGLGLSVAHGIIERHGGRLSARSVVGEGSTFTITLPLEPSNSPGERRQ